MGRVTDCISAIDVWTYLGKFNCLHLNLQNYNQHLRCNLFLQRAEDDGPDIPGAICRTGARAKCSHTSAKGASAKILSNNTGANVVLALPACEITMFPL